MKWSRNPTSGELEAYTDEGQFIGIASTMGDEVKKTLSDELKEKKNKEIDGMRWKDG